MQVLLIGPYSDSSHLTSADARMYMRKMFLAPPVGLYRIKSYLKEHDVDVFDPNLDDLSVLDEIVAEYDIVGFSMTHATLEADLSLAHRVRELNRDALLLAGGQEASFNYSQVLEYSPIDAVVLGEGELAVERICKGEPLGSISGLIVKGDICIYDTGPAKPLSSELFTKLALDMDYNAIPYNRYWRRMLELDPTRKEKEVKTVRFFTSNRCLNSCSFCSSSQFHKYSCGSHTERLQLSADTLFNQLLSLLATSLEPRRIFYQDDDFLSGEAGRSRCEALCHKIIKGKRGGLIPKDLSFMCQTRADSVYAVLLKLMAEAGFEVISYGIESFSQTVLDEFNKNLKVSKALNTLDMTYEAGIKPFLNIILSSPKSTVKDIQATLSQCIFEQKLGAGIGVNLYTFPFPGAKITEDSRELIEWEEVEIPDTGIVFPKSTKIVPEDKDARLLMTMIEDRLDDSEDLLTSDKKSNITLQAAFAASKKFNQRRKV